MKPVPRRLPVVRNALHPGSPRGLPVDEPGSTRAVMVEKLRRLGLDAVRPNAVAFGLFPVLIAQGKLVRGKTSTRGLARSLVRRRSRRPPRPPGPPGLNNPGYTGTIFLFFFLSIFFFFFFFFCWSHRGAFAEFIRSVHGVITERSRSVDGAFAEFIRSKIGGIAVLPLPPIVHPQLARLGLVKQPRRDQFAQVLNRPPRDRHRVLERGEPPPDGLPRPLSEDRDPRAERPI